jgi:lysozyme family protein
MAENQYPPMFVRAMVRVLANEGGYVHLADDPGGETNFGISHRYYPDLNLRDLTRDAAIAIYFRDFWSTERYSALPEPIALKLFDLSINMGPAHAIRCLQQALRACGDPISEDGVLGDATIAAANRADAVALLGALRSEAAGYYRVTAERSAKNGGGGESGFLEGWLNRAYQ